MSQATSPCWYSPGWCPDATPSLTGPSAGLQPNPVGSGQYGDGRWSDDSNRATRGTVGDRELHGPRPNPRRAAITTRTPGSPLAVPVSVKTSYYSFAPTHLIVDTYGYFGRWFWAVGRPGPPGPFMSPNSHAQCRNRDTNDGARREFRGVVSPGGVGVGMYGVWTSGRRSDRHPLPVADRADFYRRIRRRGEVDIGLRRTEGHCPLDVHAVARGP